MNKLCLLFVSLLISPVWGQQTIDLFTGKLTKGVSSTLPERTIEEVADGFIVTYAFNKAVVLEDPLYPNCTMWRIEGFGMNDLPAQGEFLYRADAFTVPIGCSASVEIIDSSYTDFNYRLSPARIPLSDSGNEIHTKANVPEIVPYSGFYPLSIASVGHTGIYRGNEVIKISVCPIQYSYEMGVLRVYTNISYKVSFSPLASVPKRMEKKQTQVSGNDNYLNNTTINGMRSEILQEKTSPTALLDQKDYLIISTPTFESAVRKFAEWKKRLGYIVHIALKASWTPEDVKSEVQEIYDTTGTLCYLLIIGDFNDVPAQIIPEDLIYSLEEHVTDLYYSCMDGNDDFLPDIFRGRIPVSTESEAHVVVDKIISYEKTPVSIPNYYNQGTNCAYFQDRDGNSYADRRFAQTSEDVRNYLILKGKSISRIYYTPSYVTPTHWNNGMYSFGEPLPSELLRPTFTWNGNAADIKAAIDSGTFYVLHRDHGGETLWGDPRFTISNINQLANGDKLPVVFSMNCLTGKFNSSKVCFAESFLRKNNGGCVAIMAASEISYSGYNDAFCLGMFDAIWPVPGLRVAFPYVSGTGGVTPAPTYALGQILDQGMTRLSETYGTKSAKHMQYTWEVFHCFGDPSMRIYTALPTAFANVSITRNNGSVNVNIPSSACITFYNLVTNEVKSYIGTNAVYPTSYTSNVTVCISGHNKIPYLDEGILPLYIQNTTVSGPVVYNGSVILVGNDVMPTIPEGPVVFQSGNITLTGNTVTIKPNTTINKNANFIITKN